MTAFNVVRVRVKPGREAEFMEAHKGATDDFAGFVRFAMIKTGERCLLHHRRMGQHAEPDRRAPENDREA